jgi:hypothetical protein
MSQQQKRSRSPASDDDEPKPKRPCHSGIGKREPDDRKAEHKGERQYPAKLVEFLKPLSRCQNDNPAMFSEWAFSHTNDRGQSGDFGFGLRLSLALSLGAPPAQTDSALAPTSTSGTSATFATARPTGRRLSAPSASTGFLTERGCKAASRSPNR